ncbi:efflux RND transporter permease subunit, partial [Pseudomonas syringae]|uniref:efflux RND transporter permease subunit n=1 Tax=Pseudomonas syringae TaxID=317 RepID=UPI0034D52B1D
STTTNSDGTVTTSSTSMVPLSNLVTVSERIGYQGYTRINQTPAATLSFNVNQGYTLEEAKAAFEHIQQEVGLPKTINVKYQGALLAYSTS